jgi:ATP-dependent metalloprotease
MCCSVLHHLNVFVCNESLQESYERARTVLKTHQSELKQLAQALLKYETLDVTEVKAIIEGRSVNRNNSAATTSNNQMRPVNVKPSTPSRSPSGPSQSTVPV